MRLEAVRPLCCGLLTSVTMVALAPPQAAGQVLAAKWHDQAGGRFGGTMANAGDVDGDGADDLIFGEWLYDGGNKTNSGRTLIYSGRTFALIRTHQGTDQYEYSGTSVAGVGDLDFDGHADYAIGAPGHDGSGSNTGIGEVGVYSGATGGLLWLAHGATAEALGACMARIADMDGDGRSELLVGMPNLAQARIFDGHGGLLATLSDSLGTGFGHAVAAAGDVNGDGQDDFLVSAPFWGLSIGFPNLGRVDVRSGTDAALLGSFQGDVEYDQLGWSLAGIGDVDGDGVPDLVAGVPSSDVLNPDAGYVRVVSGSTRATLRTHHGDAGADNLGWSVTSAGDFDRDGIDDYASGAIRGGANGVGLVRVFAGSDGSTLWDFVGAADSLGTNTFLGQAVLGGEFNGDGIGDLVLGDHYYVDAATSSYIGGAWLYYGCPAWWENYGAGWPGTTGVPGFVALDNPALGQPFDLALDNSLGANTAALLLVGFSAASIPTSAGGTLHVVPALTVLVPVPAAGLLLAGALPNDPALAFFEVFLQALEGDPGASDGIAFTPGLKLHCGYDL